MSGIELIRQKVRIRPEYSPSIDGGRRIQYSLLVHETPYIGILLTWMMRTSTSCPPLTPCSQKIAWRALRENLG